MKLKSLNIKNFKCFAESSIEFEDITILLGANSSGKSSIMYSILSPLQGDNFPYELSLNGKNVNLGDYKSVVKKHLENKQIVLCFTIEQDDKEYLIETEWGQDSERQVPALLKLKASSSHFELSIKKSNKYILNWNYDKSADKSVDEFSIEFQNQINSIFKKYLSIEEQHFIDYGGPIEIEIDSISDLFSLEEKVDYFLFRTVHLLGKLFQTFDNQSNFISSFRLSPERTYYEKSISNLKVERNGNNYIDQIILWESRKDKLYTTLIKNMKQIGLISSMKTNKLQGGRFEIEVKIFEKSVMASLNDVGFGISQLLPIMVADLQLEDNSTLFIAQPEIHLHPSVQANFGDYLVNQVALNKSKKYIIETHSEYLINRIRLAISKELLDPDKVNIYYFENNGQNTETHKLNFLKNGRIENAPKGFFETYMMDVMNIALEAE